MKCATITIKKKHVLECIAETTHRIELLNTTEKLSRKELKIWAIKLQADIQLLIDLFQVIQKEEPGTLSNIIQLIEDADSVLSSLLTSNQIHNSCTQIHDIKLHDKYNIDDVKLLQKVLVEPSFAIQDVVLHKEKPRK